MSLYIVPDPVTWPPDELEECRTLTVPGWLWSVGGRPLAQVWTIAPGPEQVTADIVADASRVEVLLRQRVAAKGQLAQDPVTSGGVALPGYLWSLGLSSRALATYVSAMSWASDHDTDIVPDYAWRLLTEVRGHDLDAVKAELVDVHLLRHGPVGFRVRHPRPLLKVVSPSTG